MESRKKPKTSDIFRTHFSPSKPKIAHDTIETFAALTAANQEVSHDHLPLKTKKADQPSPRTKRCADAYDWPEKVPSLEKKPSTTQEMVIDAIRNLNERGGSSLFTIKQYIMTYYKLNPDKLTPPIEKCLKEAVADGLIGQKQEWVSFQLSSKKQSAVSSISGKRSKAQETRRKYRANRAPLNNKQSRK